MEGVKVFTNEELIQAGAISEEDRMKYVEEHLKTSLEGMVRQLFGDVVRVLFSFFKLRKMNNSVLFMYEVQCSKRNIFPYLTRSITFICLR